ncbi:MAG: hypothetical protein DRJ35_03970 [Thermoprotei archaeon]|nr:MAG: hypothetical protein DRJ35_03970 [Thermoprotei archaeon]
MDRLGRILVVVLLVWAVVATGFAVKLYQENVFLQKSLESISESTITVSIGFDYGNGTVVWYNNTLVPRGASLLSATVLLVNVEYKMSDFGAYVISINGVSEKIISKNEGFSWMWYIYDFEKEKLVMGPVAADKYVLRDGDIILWKYEHWKF